MAGVFHQRKNGDDYEDFINFYFCHTFDMHGLQHHVLRGYGKDGST
jgi:hypothetical protein